MTKKFYCHECKKALPYSEIDGHRKMHLDKDEICVFDYTSGTPEQLLREINS